VIANDGSLAEGGAQLLRIIRDAARRPVTTRAERPADPSSVVHLEAASAGIDIQHDQADRAAGRVLSMPVTVVQQDWGAALGYDAATLWRPWAPDLVHHTVDSGHFMAEEAPERVTALLRQLISR
jgi:haloacetate dehalogenase